jgi:hypothetical protein
MPSSRSTALLAALAALGVSAAPASAARTVDHNPRLWATVNICDTAKHPNTIGIRASMPGSRFKRERMYMRFRVQFFSRAEQRWKLVRSGADSGWVFVGLARFAARQGGNSFEFSPPAAGSTLLRGVAYFQWRRKGKVVRRARKRTTANHPASQADPAGYSAATCSITAP